ncbi:MAG TPA: alpha/beta hydrolase [Woeseiaceae bacterium]|nr:alpha/beta hydrolase [Woeseiaceae bacterium]
MQAGTDVNSIDTVVCAHGLWAGGAGMYLVKRHLERECDMQAYVFSYPSVKKTLDENAGLLARFIEDNGIEQAHMVGHSLGGLVILRMLANRYSDIPGRIVCVGSPLRGSRVATILSAKSWGEHLLGVSVPQGTVDGSANEWARAVTARREIGSIAGSIPFGVGHVTGRFGEPNDGTVTIAETRLDGAKDHIVMPTTHTGLLISRNVAEQIGTFLRRGAFLREE